MDVFSWVEAALLLACMTLVVFVAAAEAGLITISRARVRIMAGHGVARAAVLHDYIQERDSLLRALAVAHKLALVAGAVLATSLLNRERGESTSQSVALVLGSLVVLALLESIPRTIVARNPERWGLRMAPLMGIFKLLFGGVARLLDLPLRIVTRRTEQQAQEEEEMLRLMELEDHQGSIEDDERRMIRGVFGLDETLVREIMTPRIDIIAVDTEMTPKDAIRLHIEHGFSRLPVYEKNADTVVGIVYAKDLLAHLFNGTMHKGLLEIARKNVFYVPDSKRVDDLITDMRAQRTHMAIVVDEHGGTAGLVTFEDLIEEIVGEVEDEYDRAEQQIVQISDREALFEGRVSIDDLNDLFHTSIAAEEFDTVGGCVFHLLGRMPVVGDEATTDGLKLQVVSVDRHRVRRIRVTKVERPTSENGHSEPEPETNGKKEYGVA
ncbi:MAG: hemolysin family protein [Dehalococcoidia bacterium]